MQHMRTLDQAIAQLRADDPQTSVTRHALWKMVKAGKVPHIKAGKKYLLNYDGLAILSGETVSAEQEPLCGVIRRII